MPNDPWVFLPENLSLGADIFRLAQEKSPDPFVIFRAIRDKSGNIVDFEWEFANPAAKAADANGELVGQRLLGLYPQSTSYPELFARYVRLLGEADPEVVEVEYRGKPSDGWYRNSAFALGPDRIAVCYRDITARKYLEGDLRTLADEYRHRLKNMFAVVAALVMQSAKEAADVMSLATDINRRLLALSAAQDILALESGPCGLTNLVVRVLEPFSCPGLSIEPGPELTIAHEGVVALALALNELATNALKYGSLSVPEGKVTLTWRLEGRRVSMDWIEAGGPIYAEPIRRGFGTRLIEDVAKHLPEGLVRFTRSQKGLQAQITFAATP